MMPIKTFIASNSKVLSKFIKDACVARQMTTVFLQDEKNILDELRHNAPDLIFLQASIIEHATENLIATIKADELIGSAYIVVFASRPEGAEFAYKVGGDAFLPIPFRQEQLEQIVRSILNLPKKIVVVSQNEDRLRLLRESQLFYDFTLYHARSAEEAISITGEEFPDLLLADYHLPQRSGAELSDLIKRSFVLGHIPVIIYSDSQDPALIEQCFESGANDVFLPPFDKERYFAIIQALIKPPKKGKRHIALVIDDSVTVRNLISKMLKQLGYLVMTAAHGQEALEIISRQQPDIITCDYDMPVMDGWDFCRRVRATPELAEIPLIMVSSRSTVNDKRKARSIGVSAYLTKPFTTDDLERIVKVTMAQALRNKREDHLEKYLAADAVQSVTEIVAGVTEGAVPEERSATIFSCNMVNFRQSLGSRNLHSVVRLLNEYFSAVCAILVEKGGIIDNIMGDELLVRFDQPDDQAANALNAIDAAVSIFEYLEEFNEREMESIKVRIGMSSGLVMLAHFGDTRYRMVYSMLGDAVLLAKNLQRHADEQGCLLSEETYSLVRENLGELETVEIPVRGTTRTIRAYRL